MITPGSAAYKYRMPNGVPGDVTRKWNSTIEPIILGAGLEVPYGAPISIDTATGLGGIFAPIVAGTAGSKSVLLNLYGFLVRPYPTQSTTNGNADVAQNQDVMRDGYMTVNVKVGSAKKGQPVYIRCVANGAKLVGDIEATAVVDEVFAVPNTTFNGDVDAPAIVEIIYKK